MAALRGGKTIAAIFFVILVAIAQAQEGADPPDSLSPPSQGPSTPPSSGSPFPPSSGSPSPPFPNFPFPPFPKFPFPPSSGGFPFPPFPGFPFPPSSGGFPFPPFPGFPFPPSSGGFPFPPFPRFPFPPSSGGFPFPPFPRFPFPPSSGFPGSPPSSNQRMCLQGCTRKCVPQLRNFAQFATCFRGCLPACRPSPTSRSLYDCALGCTQSIHKDIANLAEADLEDEVRNRAGKCYDACSLNH